MTLDSAIEYALSFGEDAVHLQRRERGGNLAPAQAPPAWRHMGSAEFDSASFREDFIRLRGMATGADSETELPVTLIIPDDQVLYTTLSVAPGGERSQAVGRALDGLTPYAIEDLAFDWDGDGDNVRVAAVARQTLREARDFAAQFGFTGQGYRAAPQGAAYPGEPVFQLDPVSRPRPVVDPAQAGVTAAALQFTDEAVVTEADLPADSAPDAGPDLDLGADAVLPAPELPEPAPQGEIADVAAKPAVAAISDAPPVETTVLSDALAQAPAPVIRHQPAQAKALNPRARAVHDRAASARQAGSAPAATPAPHTAGRGGLPGLIAMLGVLVVGLILIWAFLVPDKQVPPATTGAEVVTPAPEVPTASAGPAKPALAPVAPAETARRTDAPPTVIAAAPEVAAPEVAVPEVVAQNLTAPAAAPAPQPPVMISALTDEEKRRVLVAATAVAAAVVPPSASAGQAAAPALPAVVPAKPVQVASVPPAAPPSPVKPVPAPVAGAGKDVVPPAIGLTRSARPQLAPRRSTPRTTAPRADRAPQLPSDPLPFAASQARPQAVAATRPPRRIDAPAAAVGKPALRDAARPRARPEGSAPELPANGHGAAMLTPAEQGHLRDLIGDLGRLGLVLVQPVVQARAERLVQARPQRRPGNSAKSQLTASDAVSPSAVDAALRSATTPPPDRPERAEIAAAPARDSGGLLRGSLRPRARPNHLGGAAAGAAGLSGAAVEAAIAAAVNASPATPGGVRLSALTSSPLPPRRGDGGRATPAAPEPAAAPPADPVTPPAPELAAAAGPNEAELAARRKLDEQLQAQAEARIRARAAADAQAEAQARAQAEARARAQAAAEERAARAKSQAYKPPEIDDEPEIAAAAPSRGATSASVAKSATQARGIDLGRTTIIGIIGAGQASRALIRLRNGKVVTVRLGDRIDGGAINSIGNGRITYVKAGRTHELRMLDGR